MISNTDTTVLTDVSTRPVVTTETNRNTNVNTETGSSIISFTTDLTTTHNTVVETGVSTITGLQSGYAFTTDDSGQSSFVYTGTGSAASLTETPVASESAAGSSANGANGAMVTGAPLLGATIAGIAAFVV